MSQWVHDLPIGWMAVVMFAVCYAAAATTFALSRMLSGPNWSRAYKAVSPGMLPPLGIIFGLFVAFTASQVWSDNDRAAAAVSREAGALSVVVFLAGNLPGDHEGRIQELIGRYVDDAAKLEWPMMARGNATPTATPPPLAEALKIVLGAEPRSLGEQNVQREMGTALENAFDARRQRILLSQSQVNLVKWFSFAMQAFCMLFAIAVVHNGDTRSAAVAMGLFASGVAVSALLIVAHDRPFVGHISIGPGPLLDILPGGKSST